MIDIEKEVRQEALVFEKHYYEGQTQDIIDRITKNRRFGEETNKFVPHRRFSYDI